VIVISDTNILSSLAAAESLPLLFQLFSKAQICIPPAVEQELQVGLGRGQRYLTVVLQAVTAGQLSVLTLSAPESALAQSLPRSLNAGECEAIAMAKTREALLLSNDKRAIRYCQQSNIEVLDLATILNLLWTRQFISKKRVGALIERMEKVEGLTLNQVQRQRVFAPPTRRRQRRHKS
jgi:predicted nucleic acid-binding protein